MDNYDDYEPMDVDVSSNSSVSKMDISSDDIDLTVVKEEPREFKYEKRKSAGAETAFNESIFKTLDIDGNRLVKKYHVQINRSKLSRHNLPKTIFLISSIIAVIAIISYHLLNYKCAGELEPKWLKEKLEKVLYGQDEAIYNIFKALKSVESSKILFFFGGTGVGKTYAASIILEDRLYSSNVYHFTMPSFADTFSPELLIGMAVCNESLIVVDDLTISDKNITSHIRGIVEKNKALGKNTTIILIYNCDIVEKNFNKRCDKGFLGELKKLFKNVEATKFFIQFDRLKEEQLIQCIAKELKKFSDVNYLEDAEIEDLLSQFDVLRDGCKGVYRKVRYFMRGDNEDTLF